MESAKRERLHKLGLTAFKFCLVAVVTIGIGTALAAFGPDGKVQEAEADVWNFGLFKRTNTQKFASSLERLGHEPPRSYDVNGNKVFFSVRSSPKRPYELVEEYQRTFVEEGLNTEAYGYEEKTTQQAERVMGGQIIPFQVDRDVFTMGGVVLADSPASVKEWDEMKDSYRGRTLHDAFVGYRHVQADWDPDKRRTFVTASWSDEDFDMRRISGADTERMPEENDVPLCIGCKRTIRWETDDNDVPYTVNVMLAPMDIDNVVSFYERAMADGGWQMSGATTKTTDNAGARLLEFQKDGRRIQLSMLSTGPRNTRVTTVEIE